MTAKLRQRKGPAAQSDNLLELPGASRVIIWLSIVVYFGSAVGIVIWFPAVTPIAWGLIAVGLHSSFMLLRNRR
jgi:hypothetical protein